ncbi:MAG: hypothetical protein GF317_13345 [Candidatus Lokiarchaeota archaeon]|nr:hypothetical protein [Candidatus Lokiarchaeota archaeon]MBD3200622.1 hypothetical protein [Candidatus Lokiarchaeota archaeon]
MMKNNTFSDYLDDDLRTPIPNKYQNKTKSLSCDLENIKIILEILKLFKTNHSRKLNISKLRQKLNISRLEMDKYLDLIITFQDLFSSIFSKHHLQIKEINNIVYLITKKKNPKKDERVDIKPKEVCIKKVDISSLNDIIYSFRNVRRGKGFDIYNINSELVKEVKRLRVQYPVLFYQNGNNLVYPSEIGLTLGDKIISYYKCNREIKNLIIKNLQFKIK